MKLKLKCASLLFLVNYVRAVQIYVAPRPFGPQPLERTFGSVQSLVNHDSLQQSPSTISATSELQYDTASSRQYSQYFPNYLSNRSPESASNEFNSEKQMMRGSDGASGQLYEAPPKLAKDYQENYHNSHSSSNPSEYTRSSIPSASPTVATNVEQNPPQSSISYIPMDSEPSRYSNPRPKPYHSESQYFKPDDGKDDYFNHKDDMSYLKMNFHKKKKKNWNHGDGDNHEMGKFFKDSKERKEDRQQYDGYEEKFRDSRDSTKSDYDKFKEFGDFLKSKNNRDEFSGDQYSENNKEPNSHHQTFNDHGYDHHYYGHHHHHGHYHPKKYHHNMKPHHYHHQKPKPIPAAIDTKHSVETYHKKSKKHQHYHPVVDIDSGPLPITLRFHSHSSQINAIQHHISNEGKVHKSTTVDEPDLLIKEIEKPVIQKITEKIHPTRIRVQEVAPVHERIETVIARGDGEKKKHHHHHHKDHYKEHRYHHKDVYHPHRHHNYDHPPTYLHDEEQPATRNHFPSIQSYQWANSEPIMKNGNLINSLAQSDDNLLPLAREEIMRRNSVA